MRQLFCCHGRIAAVLLSMVFMNCGESSISQEIVVDLSGAKALIMPSSDTTARLDLQSLTTEEEAKGLLRKVLEDGTIQPVIYYLEEGSEKRKVVATVKPGEVFVGSDNQVYISFEASGVMARGKRCCLIRVDPKGKDPVRCFGDEEGLFDPGLYCLGHTDPRLGDGSGRYHHQLDDKGNLYFWANGIHKLPPDGKASLELTPPGSVEGVTDKPSCFAVSRDGSLYFSGKGGSGEEYFRRRRPDGAVESLKEIPSSFAFASSGDFFVDSNGVYRGSAQGSKMVLENLSVDRELYYGALLNLDGSPSSNPAGLVTSTGRCGLEEGPFFEDVAGRIYFVRKQDYRKDDNARVLRIFPGKPVRVSNKDNKVAHVQIKGNSLYYSGLDSAKKNIFRRIDLNDPKFPETDLLKGQEIEVYKFDVSSSGKIYFGGLKLPDNKYFAGTIDGTTLEMKVVAPDTKLSELVVTE